MIEPDDRSYQNKAVRQIDHFNGRALLAYEMRMGKTFIGLKWLKKHLKIRPVIVVCPEIGKYHWEEKAKQYFGIRGTVLNGITPPKRKFIQKNELYILNWDILQYWVEFLRHVGIVAIILDEVHYIKDENTACYRATKNLSMGVKYLIGLGGTGGMKSRPMELFNILNLLRPDKFPSRLIYGFRYCKPERKPWGWEFKGASHLDELHRNLKAWCLIRALRKDKMGEQPKDRRIITLPISNEEEYFEAEHSFISWLGKRSRIRVVKAKKAERLVQMGYLKRLAASLKMKYALEWTDRWLDKKQGKLAIFAIHKEIIEQLKERYKGQCVVIDGSVTGRKRYLAVKTFQNENWCRIFIGNTRAAGTVIELSKAQAVIGFELDWTPGDVKQWEDRIYDPDDKKAMRIYYLVARDTIEHRLCEILQLKQDNISATLDGDKAVDRLSIFDQLQRKLLLKG